MAKNNKTDNIENRRLNNMLPDILDRKHQMIPIVTNTDDESMEDVNVPEILPILTLRSSVLFPGAITPITVGREKSIALVRAVNSEGGLLGAYCNATAKSRIRRRTTVPCRNGCAHTQNTRNAERQP